MKIVAVAAICLFAASPAVGKTVFYTYDGPPQVRTGEGGIKTTVLGIEFWAEGAPNREYRVIGNIVDSRAYGDGDAMESKSVAKKAKAAGGDAVLLTTRESQDGGVASFGGNGVMPSTLVPLGSTTTTFVVIAYTSKK